MTLLTLAAKDLKQRLRDRSFFMLGIVVPLALVLILSNVIGDDESDFSTTLVVVDQDSGTLADELAGLGDSGISIVTADSRSEAVDMIENGEASAGFLIPEGFTAATRSFQAAEIEVLGNPTAQISTLISEAIAQGVASEVETVQTAIAAAGFDQALAASEAALATPSPISVEEVAVGNRQLDFTTYISIGIAIFFLYFTVQFGILSILEEQRDGTMARLLAAPLSPGTLLIGKSLSSVVTGLISMGVLILGTTLIMGASWGNPFGVFVLVVAGIFSAMGIGALLGTLTKTPEQAGNFASIVAVVLGILGGSFFPVAQSSGLLASLSKLSPHSWLLQGFGDNTGSGRLGDVLTAAAIVAVTGLVPGAIALLRRDRMGVTT